MKKILIALAASLAVVGLSAAPVVAQEEPVDPTPTTEEEDQAAYPPPPPPTTTTIASQPPATTTTTVAISVQPPPGQLPRTGAGFDQPLLVGLTALIVGGGLILVARQRRSSENA